MKTKIFFSAMLTMVLGSGLFAQDRTTVTATNPEISDNLDLKAVASIFGDSENLEDFERRLNDPKMQISNLDLNRDNQVDYLRVIESVEGNTHLIIVQAVLERDIFQDVATVEVERNGNNVQVQVVGDVYMYGNNYIYEPVYVQRPIIYDYFWATGYRPYVSTWYWGYYPSYYYAWNPYPIYRYRRNVNVYINVHNHYNYVNVRRSQRAIALHNTRRANAYEVRNPQNAFNRRNPAVANRYELAQTRTSRNGISRNNASSANTRSNDGSTSQTRNNSGTRTSNNSDNIRNNGTRNQSTSSTIRTNGNTRNQSASTTDRNTTRNQSPATSRSESPASSISNSSATRNTSTVNTRNNSAANRSTNVAGPQATRQTSMNTRTQTPRATAGNERARVNSQPSMQAQRSNAGSGNVSRQSAPTRSTAQQSNESQRGGRR